MRRVPDTSSIPTYMSPRKLENLAGKNPAPIKLLRSKNKNPKLRTPSSLPSVQAVTTFLINKVFNYQKKKKRRVGWVFPASLEAILLSTVKTAEHRRAEPSAEAPCQMCHFQPIRPAASGSVVCLQSHGQPLLHDSTTWPELAEGGDRHRSEDRFFESPPIQKLLLQDVDEWDVCLLLPASGGVDRSRRLVSDLQDGGVQSFQGALGLSSGFFLIINFFSIIQDFIEHRKPLYLFFF